MLQPVIKWSGSKRSQARSLIAMFPNFKTYYEPFVGGGSVLYALKPSNAVCGDNYEPLVRLWKLIQTNPIKLSASYRVNWERLQSEGSQVYYEIRDRFNHSPNPEDLFFLSRTCVNGLIRFNKSGEFNNSFHLTRKGMNPSSIEKLLLNWSKTIQSVDFVYADYGESTKNASSEDFIYLDPPYFNTKDRYFGTIDFNEFVTFLEGLNKRKIRYVLSYDGMRSNNIYLKNLPKHLYVHHILLPSGNAPFRKVMDKKSEMVQESVYSNF